MLLLLLLYLIEILHQTTTSGFPGLWLPTLYLIEILHQTTTARSARFDFPELYLIEILHQTTTSTGSKPVISCCILLKFYIKPQHLIRYARFFAVVSYWNSTSNHNASANYYPALFVVSYWNSTSNHNPGLNINNPLGLYLIEILHQTTTMFYTTRFVRPLYLIEILHQTTTWHLTGYLKMLLYLIEILHQTTTSAQSWFPSPKLYLIEILHQTTTRPPVAYGSVCCILLKFYIKPQLISSIIAALAVVSYWNSTSNHNHSLCCYFPVVVVSYWNSTSNHNTPAAVLGSSGVVSYWNSTSNHNTSRSRWSFSRLYLIEILHQTTTALVFISTPFGCILLKFYIKPQLLHKALKCSRSCILLKFYIKPQHLFLFLSMFLVVSYWNSTSNHNVGPHIDW